MVGTQIGNYRIVRSIGAGGMGVVYEALDPRIARRAAIKVLRADLAADPEVAARFINEARPVNKVHHSGIVDIFEVAQLAGAAYIVMEFLDGESLARRMEAFPAWRCAAVVRAARQIASAMAAAHARNIVHRDLKPDNVMLVADPETHAGERTKLLDFGIAKLEHALALDVRTRTGLLMGTPTYMAPEQYRGSGLVDDRADVYSLGVVLFEMLSGTLPFCSGTPAEMMAAHLFDEPPDLQRARPDAPAPLVALVSEIALAKAPGQRPSMVQIGAQLELLGAPRQTGPMAAEPPATISSTTPLPSTLGGAVGERVVRAPATRRAPRRGSAGDRADFDRGVLDDPFPRLGSTAASRAATTTAGGDGALVDHVDSGRCGGPSRRRWLGARSHASGTNGPARSRGRVGHHRAPRLLPAIGGALAGC